MINDGEIPMVDCGIFSDVGAEPKTVYEHLDWLEKMFLFLYLSSMEKPKRRYNICCKG